MSKRLLGWVVISVLSVAACTKDMESQPCDEECRKEKEREREREREKEREKENDILCEKGDERCEVGDGKCVVGYDGDCPTGQVCYAGEGAPKGKQGTCTDGRFDADGKLATSVAFREFKQGERRLFPYKMDVPARECFGCYDPGHTYQRPPDWLGRAPASLLVSIQGPHAEKEQLKATVRGMPHEGCKPTTERPKYGTFLEGQLWWKCEFAEGFAGLETTEPLELQLWTERSQAFPWKGSFLVDTLPMALVLETHLSDEFLVVNTHKRGVPRDEMTRIGASLQEVSYSSLKVFAGGDEISVDWEPRTHLIGNTSDYRLRLLLGLGQTGPLTLEATVSAKDRADNEVSNVPLTTTLGL